MNIVDESAGRHTTDFVALSRLSRLKRLRVQSDAILTGVLSAIIDERLPLDCLIMDNPSACYPTEELAQLVTVKCLKLGRIHWHHLKMFANAIYDADEIEIFTEFIRLSHIPEILCVWKRTKKVTFRILCYDKYHIGDDPVRDVQAIADICMERGLDVRVVVEVDEDCDREGIVEVRVWPEWLLTDRTVERFFWFFHSCQRRFCGSTHIGSLLIMGSLIHGIRVPTALMTMTALMTTTALMVTTALMSRCKQQISSKTVPKIRIYIGHTNIAINEIIVVPTINK